MLQFVVGVSLSHTSIDFSYQELELEKTNYSLAIIQYFDFPQSGRHVAKASWLGISR